MVRERTRRVFRGLEGDGARVAVEMVRLERHEMARDCKCWMCVCVYQREFAVQEMEGQCRLWLSSPCILFLWDFGELGGGVFLNLEIGLIDVCRADACLIG